MKTYDFAIEFSYTDIFEEYVDSSYWTRSFRTEEAFQLMLKQAKRLDVLLIDLDDFDYDTFFYSCYRDMEKGLS